MVCFPLEVPEVALVLHRGLLRSGECGRPLHGCQRRRRPCGASRDILRPHENGRRSPRTRSVCCSRPRMRSTASRHSSRPRKRRWHRCARRSTSSISGRSRRRFPATRTRPAYPSGESEISSGDRSSIPPPPSASRGWSGGRACPALLREPPAGALVDPGHRRPISALHPWRRPASRRRTRGCDRDGRHVGVTTMRRYG